ncbi:tyrosine-type recombinase/integrase [Polynucleobacter sp. AP-Latsch-80-C2]|jgi:integrase|uniref:tyrosine-type recombinase/integrase n=1 Tax=Polynucleobacter sp. AP-Latsch-80-C2 TaxID=2576931 RepID=UPI001C0BCE9B|nr:tyrosine-type recombinase/integrase [Polynucleobacter sp. AP-Latsch-80-C2]MBU3623632.1 tyrosine-type recombinase/integrase [Polynucleobacter sp. AP-Latsch-80-C2]
MSLLQQFNLAQVDADADKNIKAVGGKATLYKRSSTQHWQVRFKLANNKWHSQSTCTPNKDEAIAKAELIYQTVQIKTQAGLTPITKTFKQIAVDEVKGMTQAMASGVGKRTYRDYIFATNKYLIPFFGNYTVENITTELVRDFEGWRIAVMGRIPMQSTKRNHSSAYIRIINLAKERGVISSTRVVPMLDSKGEKSRARPAFSDGELEALIAYVPSWIETSYTARTRQMRILCGVYIEFLVNTGIRHGTEALPLRWKHLQWHYIGEKKYLRIWVSGKTGPRYLIAKNEVLAVLERLMQWQELAYATLDALIEAKLDKLIFRLTTGEQISNMENIFRNLMKHSGLMFDSGGQRRTLYSLRHTYATRALAKGVDIHTLARQMGTSVLMIEKHYSKITPMLSAEKLA